VTEVAERIAGGALSARLDETLDPDLVALSGSFNRMADGLERRIAREARFASDVSHELRSPLTTLSTALSVLERRRGELSAEGGQALDLLSADVSRFQKTVLDLIEISRHDAGGVPVDLDTIPIAEAVRRVVRRLGVGYAVEVAPSAVGALVSIDVRRLERILANFVDNAEVHGGGVTRIAVWADGGHAFMAVEDRGPGIPAGEADRVFERFARGGLARRRGSLDGSGLGLSLAAENAQLVGGRVFVDPGHEPGARLVFATPVEGSR
jgi:two-component system, OmpR family, sensor histidine kinase MtrB